MIFSQTQPTIGGLYYLSTSKKLQTKKYFPLSFSKQSFDLNYQKQTLFNNKKKENTKRLTF